ncbi:MAG: hypothetical protein OEW00_14240, partial [candidate division Zixibacteria bacterium]|nr:hypothetical protein [candidate division Zixibacteria bacterium]
AALSPPTLCAQGIRLEPEDRGAFTLEVMVPKFPGRYGSTYSNVVVFASLKMAASDKTAVVFEIPYARSSYEYSYCGYYGCESLSESQSSLGNVYIGAEFSGRNRDFFTSIGIRLPSASEESAGAWTAGLVADIDRWGSFGKDLFVANVAANYYHQSRSGFVSWLRAGPTLLKYSSTACQGGDLFFQYGYQAGFNAPPISSMVGISGLMILTAEEATIAERTMHQLSFSATYTAGSFRPGFQARIPLDEDLKDILEHSIGLSLSYVFK